MAPQIVEELRRENAKLRADLARLRRQEEWVAGMACRRIKALEDGLMSMRGTYGSVKRVDRIIRAALVEQRALGGR